MTGMLMLKTHDEVEPSWALLFRAGKFIATTRIGNNLWREYAFPAQADMLLVHPDDLPRTRRSHRNYVCLFVLTRIGCT